MTSPECLQAAATAPSGSWVARREVDDSIATWPMATYAEVAAYIDGFDDVYPCELTDAASRAEFLGA